MTGKLIGNVGNYVVGDRFWGREKELERLLELIGEGANISIIAPRRIGKTSLMREAKEHHLSDSVTLYIDLQAAKSAADMVTSLTVATRAHASVWEKTKGVFGNAFAAFRDNVDSISVSDLTIKVRSGLVADDWQDKGAQVLDALASQEKPVVIFIDELPIMIERMLDDEDVGVEAVHTLLAWLRAKALEHQGKLCMVFAGSIGLEPVLNRANLTADINHLTPFVLEPWADPVAFGCIKALAAHRNLDLADESINKMLELLGCNIPHHVQLFFATVREYCHDKSLDSCSSEIVEEVFHLRMLSTRGHAELSHMEERLGKMFNENELYLAMDILTQIAIKNTIELGQIHALCERHHVPTDVRRSLLPEMFNILEHDGYLKKNTANKYVFESNLLREWWRTKFGAFFELAKGEA